MSKYIIFYRAPMIWTEKPDVTPEDMQAGMQAWMKWSERCGDGLVDFGSPLGEQRLVTPSGSAPSDSDVVGFSMLEADDMDAALALCEGHPHLEWMDGCEISVHEFLSMG